MRPPIHAVGGRRSVQRSVGVLGVAVRSPPEAQSRLLPMAWLRTAKGMLMMFALGADGVDGKVRLDIDFCSVEPTLKVNSNLLSAPALPLSLRVPAEFQFPHSERSGPVSSPSDL